MLNGKFKICLIGENSVGKSALVNRFLTGLFDNGINPTIGIDFHIKNLYIYGKNIMLEIFDFSGEKRFRFLLPKYIREASGLIFMYDITRYSSLKNIIEWLQIFKESSNGEQKEIPLLMVGAKLDLQNNRSVAKEEAIKIAKSNGFCDFIECSAKNGQNVELIFYNLVQILLGKKRKK